MSASGENAIVVLKCKVLKVILGTKQKGDLFRAKSNAELFQLYQEADIVKKIRVNEYAWLDM